MPTTPETSAVRDSTRLIAAAEELMAEARNPRLVSDFVAEIAAAAKAMRPHHIDDTLAHIAHRAERIEAIRPLGWLVDSDDLDAERGPVHITLEHDDPEHQARRTAAVDALIDADPKAAADALAARVQGDDDDG
jgi:hypothetical protein